MMVGYDDGMSDNPSSPVYWDKKYDDGHFPWDLGQPAPVFQRVIDSGEFLPGRMIVLGAGRGFDARLFANNGFEVTAVDFAPHAVQAMHNLQDTQAPIQIVQDDIFALPSDLNGAFDYLLEYTCFCAINPQQRGTYFDLVSRLLKPGGTYIALAFPIGTRSGGPPFTVSPSSMIESLQDRGFRLHKRERPHDSVPARKGIEELIILLKDNNAST